MADLLVVEDDPDIATSLRDLLAVLGHRVRVAGNGEEGLKALNERLPDLVLLDVEMPVLDGPGMAYRMLIENAGRERIPVMLLSGIMDLHLVARRVGTPYFLPKPYSLDAFQVLLQRSLTERTPPHPLAGGS